MPVLSPTGALLRIQVHFFAPRQLQSVERHRALMTGAYSTYSLGVVLLSLGVMALVPRIAVRNRTWAFCKGTVSVR